MDHVNAGLTISFGVLSSVVGFMFNVPEGALLAILGGAVLGVGIKRPVGFINGFFIVIGVFVSLAWILPALTDNLVYLKAAGVVSALVITAGRSLVQPGIDKIFNAGVDEVIGVIKATGSVIKRRLGSKEEPIE
jgi:hypothetical protein